MSWRVARSLVTYRKQVDDAFPMRSRESDGTIGDAAHSARTSDHNPDEDGVVKAFDLTHDPKNGVDCNVFAKALIDSRDPRIKYIIWDKKIISGDLGPSSWFWRPYSGKNPHTKHMHISVRPEAVHYDNTRPWALPGKDVAKPQPQAPAVRETLRRGSRGDSVKELQKMLGVKVDGIFGTATAEAVAIFQDKYDLIADGIVGPATWEKLESCLPKNKPSVSTPIKPPVSPSGSSTALSPPQSALVSNKVGTTATQPPGSQVASSRSAAASGQPGSTGPRPSSNPQRR